MFRFFPWLFLSDVLIISVKFVLNKVGFDCTLFDLFIKLLLMVSPLFPTMEIWRCRDDFGGPDGTTDGVIDTCIGVWFVLILAVSLM